MHNSRGMKKTLYVLPGFGETTKDKPYRQIATFARSAGYEVVMYSPQWSRAVPSDWLAGFQSILPLNPVGKATVFGFSFGAYVALNAATQFKFDRVIACSAPPFFHADIPDIDDDTREFLGKRRMADLEKYKFPAQLKTHLTLMNGAEEDAEDIEKSGGYFTQWSGKKKRVLVERAEHDLETGDYLKAIKDALGA